MFKLIRIVGVVSFLLSYAKIFKYGDFQNTSLTPDKELNILIYRTSSCVIIYQSYTLLTSSSAIAEIPRCRLG